MTVPGANQRLNKFLRMTLRSLLYLLPLLLMSQLVGQPEFDDRYPVVGGRALRSKIFKQEQPIKSGLLHVPQLSLAVGGRLFTPEFYRTFVRLGGQQDPVQTLLVYLHSSRAPPRGAVS